MSMSQKDYVIIASALRRGAELAARPPTQGEIDRGDNHEIAIVDYTITQVCNALEAAHAGRYPFKRGVFRSAAGHSQP